MLDEYCNSSGSSFPLFLGKGPPPKIEGEGATAPLLPPGLGFHCLGPLRLLSALASTTSVITRRRTTCSTIKSTKYFMHSWCCIHCLMLSNKGTLGFYLSH